MIDVGIIILYLGVVLFAGLWGGTRVKNFKEYSLANKNFPTTVMVASIFATMVGGGSTMGVAEKIFSTGNSFLLVAFAFVISSLINAYFIVPKFSQFADCISVGDIMARFYGKTGKLFSGIAGMVLSTVGLAMQISAMGFLAQYFLHIPHWMGSIISIGVVMLYSTYGGMRSVTITDVVEFGVLIVAIPVTFTIGVEMVGGITGIIASVPASHLTLWPDADHSVRYFSLMIAFLFPYLNPVLVQRLLMGRNTEQVKKAMLISNWARFPYVIMVAVLGLVALVLNPAQDANLAFLSLVDTILPIGIKGFVIAGLMAVIMSTSDSYMHVCGVMITHDVIRPLSRGVIRETQELRIARYATCLVGVCSTIIALAVQNIVELNILIFVSWLPVISVPLVAGIMGIRARTEVFLASACAGISTYFMWNIFFKITTNIDSILPALVASGSVFFMGHFLTSQILKIKKPV